MQKEKRMLCNRNDFVWHKNEFISIDRYDCASKAMVVSCCGVLGCYNLLQRHKERRNTMNPDLPDLPHNTAIYDLVVEFVQTVRN